MIYGITGFSRVGKDTLASLHPELTRFAFADALKSECNEIIHKYLGSDLDFFDEKTKVKHRNLLVEWGEIAREADPFHWISKIDIEDNSIITDVRYKNEAEWIKSIGGKIIYLSRPDFGPANAIEGKNIQEIIDSDLIDWVISNNGTFEDLRNRTKFIKPS